MILNFFKNKIKDKPVTLREIKFVKKNREEKNRNNVDFI